MFAYYLFTHQFLDIRFDSKNQIREQFAEKIQPKRILSQTGHRRFLSLSLSLSIQLY